MSDSIGILIGQGELDGKQFEISEKGLVIGREPGAVEVVLQGNRVSRKHARLEVLPDGDVILRDLESKNGTFRNGRKIEKPVTLQSGDRLEFGECGREAFVFVRKGVKVATAPTQLDRSGEWHAGDVVEGIYEVKSILGEGGFGRVYRVHHRNWNTDLAVKCLHPNLVQSEKHRKDFERECEGWIELGLRPNIVSCYYVRNLGGTSRVFSEFMDGGSLAKLTPLVPHRRDEGGYRVYERQADP